ncbi:hypothetical protein RQP54_18245 [Curvibacter sp. APW13]|uniref:hypothetical protein n=1 Tax=Curvibacter sp. APW13 TaxID=3077236 RepID=UPI0028DE8DB6|nr:hypothetical protein [Curvibacter sp. APW13]MDT8992820.1 hypothetical protein [Curvibacter sp. APW13]
MNNSSSFMSESNPTPQLTHAMLVWTLNDGHVPAYASINPVKDGVVQHQKDAVSSKQLLQFSQDLIAPLAKNALKDRKVEITPSTVLLSDPINDLTVWWRPGRPTPQFFDCDELGTIQGVCHMPGLVFAQKGRSLSICAVAGNYRPLNESAVFHAPMFNTGNRGDVCLGGVRLKPIQQWADIDTNETAFLRGINTHPNGNHVKTSYPTGLFALWRDLIGNPQMEWDDAWLTPMKTTLQQWIKGCL